MRKKLYSSPDIFFEDFSLSTNIAAGCEEKPHNSTDTCGVLWTKGTILFINGVTDDCTKKVIDGSDQGNGLCYHNPSDSYNVFFS
jgi:hypothetical protein